LGRSQRHIKHGVTRGRLQATGLANHDQWYEMCDNLPMTSATVRDVEERDLDQLLGLYRQLAEGDVARMPTDTETSRGVLQAIISDTSRWLCVATAGEAVVGAAEILVVPDLTHQGRPWAVIENVIVSEVFRGRGVGTCLLEHLADIAQASGCYKVQLHSGKQRVAAHRLYRKLGFVSVAEGFKLYFDNPPS
jgi:ribosomal protein S18 acetylase RimI-like enzyme